MTDLSKNIQRLRKAKQMTQPELADRLQLPRETIIAWERSEIIPEVDSLPAIAEALDTDVVTLLYPQPESAEKPFRPGCGFVFAALALYYLMMLIAGEWGMIFGPVVFMAICTSLILEAIDKK